MKYTVNLVSDINSIQEQISGVEVKVKVKVKIKVEVKVKVEA